MWCIAYNLLCQPPGCGWPGRTRARAALGNSREGVPHMHGAHFLLPTCTYGPLGPPAPQPRWMERITLSPHTFPTCPVLLAPCLSRLTHPPSTRTITIYNNDRSKAPSAPTYFISSRFPTDPNILFTAPSGIHISVSFLISACHEDGITSHSG